MEPSGVGSLPDFITDVADVSSSSDAVDLLSQVADGVGTVVGAISDIAS